MSQLLVSIIIPMYNASQFINSCIDSISNQKYENFELILVDDCSTDDTFAKCRKYEIADSRIRLIKNQSNMGVAASRNYGVEVSEGVLIVFIDADDVVAENYLNELFTISQEYPSYLAMCSMQRFPNENGAKADKEMVDVVDVAHYLNNQYLFHPWCWACAFKASIIRKYNIKFTDEAKFAEDAYFVAKYLCFADGVAISPKSLYYYYIHDEGGAIYKRNKNYDQNDVIKRCSSLTALKDAILFVEIFRAPMVPYIKSGYCFLAADILLMIERAKFYDCSYKKELETRLKISNRLRYIRYCKDLKHALLVECVAINVKLLRFFLDDMKLIYLRDKRLR